MNQRTFVRFARKTPLLALALGPLLLSAGVAEAQTPDGAPAAEAPPAPKPPPYSLPFQLRPVAPGNVVRSDTAFAFYENAAGESGSTVASTLLASYKVLPNFAPLVRLGVVQNSPPEAPAGAMPPPPDSGVSFTNPVLGGIFAPELPAPFKLGLFLGVTLPVGTGGGDTPDAAQAAANAAGITARSAMDNAMFAVNYLTIFPGVDFAYVKDGLTLQAEVTLLQLLKTRGPDALDDKNTNLTAGLHAGYFIIPALSVGAEIRHQRWLSTPTPVEANDELRETSTFAVGPRAHFKLGETMWLRPAVAFAMPLDNPMADTKHKIVQLDIPFAF